MYQHNAAFRRHFNIFNILFFLNTQDQGSERILQPTPSPEYK